VWGSGAAVLTAFSQPTWTPRRIHTIIPFPTGAAGRIFVTLEDSPMRSSVFPLAALFLFCATARADDAADARALVEKGIKATGQKPGDKPGALTWKDKGKFTAAGMAMDYTGDWAFQGPDKYRFAVNAEVEGMKFTFIAISNGNKAWESALGMTQEMTEDKLEYFLNQTYALNVTSLLPLLADKEFKLATAGEKDVNGKKTAVVTVTRDKKPTVTLYFDKQTGLLVKSGGKVKDEFQGWKEVPEEVFYDDYKDVGGRKYFSKMKIVRDGKPMIETTISDQKLSDKLDAKLFEKP
jgi:outer membrane lipoprotein-sorting protein